VTIKQQDIRAMHRARQRMVNHRTAVVSQIRGLLLDRGFAFAKSITRARRTIPVLLSDMTNGLTAMARENDCRTVGPDVRSRPPALGAR
jgi:transposase